MEKIFKLKENGTTVRTEIIAGLTTFMTMAYIIALNPNLIVGFGQGAGGGFGADGAAAWNGVFLATCLASAIAMFCMAFLANKPFCLAPGMGLNSFFAIVIAQIAGAAGCSYLAGLQAGLCIILIEGIVFIVLSIFNIREKIVDAIPLGVRLGIAPAIGLMLMNIGFGSNAGVGAASEHYVMRDFFGALTPSTAQTSMGEFYPKMVLYVVTMFIGLFVIVLLAKKGIKGAVLIGMLASSVIYWIGSFAFLATNPFESLATANWLPPFGDMAQTTLFKFDFATLFKLGWFTVITLVITFCMIDMFDTIGTLVGTASRAGMVDKQGNMPNMKEAVRRHRHRGRRLHRHLHRHHLCGVRLRRGGRRPHGPHRPDLRRHLPGLYVYLPHRRHHPRRRHLRCPDLCRCADAPGAEEREVRRYGPDGARGPDAHRHAHLQLHRPCHWPGPDLLHRDQGVLRQGQGRVHAHLRHLPAVPDQVLPHRVMT